MTHKADLIITEEQGKTEARQLAELSTAGVIENAQLQTLFTNIGEQPDLTTMAAVLNEKSIAASEGDLSGLETMLAAQAMTLNQLFTHLAMRSQQNMGSYINAVDKYMRMALKAQNQCRMTIETLAEMKHPKPLIQHNSAVNQQVNNGIVNGTSANPTHAQENQNQPNELLSHDNIPTMPIIEEQAHETVE